MLFIQLLFSVITFTLSVNTTCTSLFHVWKHVTRGVDVSRFDLWPLQVDKIHLSEHIFSTQCYSQRNITIPLDRLKDYKSLDWSMVNVNNTPQLLHSIPDDANIELLVSERPVSLQVRSVYSDEYEFARTTTSSLGLISRYQPLGLFCKSQLFMQLREQRFTNTENAHEAQAFVKVYNVKLDDHTKRSFSKAFHNAITSLNVDTYDANAFENILSIFGTHYFEQIQLGGLVRVTVKPIQQLHGSQIYKYDTVEGFDYENQFAYERLPLTVHDNFAYGVRRFVKNHTLMEKRIYLYGGVMQENGINLLDWADTVPLNPCLLGGKLQPISQLLSDNRKQHYMALAIRQYLAKEEVISLENALMRIQQLEIALDSEALQEHLEKIREINRSSPPPALDELLVKLRPVIEFMDEQVTDYFEQNPHKMLEQAGDEIIEKEFSSSHAYMHLIAAMMGIALILAIGFCIYATFIRK